MSVAAMTMDDQRPMMNSPYEKMSTKYEQTMHAAATVGAAGSGSALTTTTTTPTSTLLSSSSSAPTITTIGLSAAPPSGPASPTPSSSEEPHHHHHHQHHHHHTPPQQQQQQHHNSSSPSTSSASQPQAIHPHNHHHTPHHHQQQQQQAVAAAAEQRQRLLEEEIDHLKSEQARLSQQCADAQRREKILMRRLANKEQEFQDYVSQIAEYKAAQAPSAVALRSALLDPAVNLLFEKLKKELKATKAKLEETQNELSAWKFTPDSNTGKRLMAKCRLLYQENEELGKMTSNGRLAKLENELAMQKSFSEEVKKSQSELDDFLQELDEDVEGMQSTILYLQQELKTTRDRSQALEKENFQLKNGIVAAATEAASVHIDQTDMQMHIKLNGNQSNTSAVVSAGDVGGGELYQTMQDESTTSTLTITNASSAAFSITTNDEVKYQTTTTMTTHGHVTPNVPIVGGHLETIDENACMRSGGADYYNGLGVSQDQATPPTISADEADSNNCMPSKFRSMASRKRNYDTTTADCNVEPVPVATSLSCVSVPIYVGGQSSQAPVSAHVPRTLPPKKSKLRGVTPVRRSSVQSVEMNDMTAVVDNNGGGNYNAAINQLPMVDQVACNADNAVMGGDDSTAAMMVNNTTEDTITTSVVDGSGVAQRIMTRRRSVRTCVQNGSGGDSNH